MTALARKQFEDLGFNASLNEIIRGTGDTVREHYFLNIIDVAHCEDAPKEVLEFSEVFSFGFKPTPKEGFCPITGDRQRNVEYETMKATIDLIDRDFFFSNIIGAIEEAMERLAEYEEKMCFTICYENTDLTFAEMALGLETFIHDHFADMKFLVGHHKQTLSVYTA
jgi:hypothetical protein